MSLAASNALVGGPVRRYGGKGLMADKLVPYFAAADQFVEPFFGGGGVFFQLPVGHWRTFVINDLDKDVTAFFSCLRDRTDELIQACELTPYSREEYERSFDPTDDRLEKARRFWVRARQGFSGIDRKGNGWSRPSVNVGLHDGMNSKLESFRMFASALRKAAAIECADAVEIVKNYGLPGAFIYCDPPYVAESRDGMAYNHEMTTEQHRAFGAACNAAAAKGAMIAISGYHSALYDELFEGWRVVEIPMHLVTQHGSAPRTEVLWLSYSADKEIGHARPAIVSGKSALEKALAKQRRR